MGPEPHDEFVAEEEGGVHIRPAGVSEKLHPVSTHLHPGQGPVPSSQNTPVASAPAVAANPVAQAGMLNTLGSTATATLTRTHAVNESKAKGYTGNACLECGQLTMVRNGACEKCDSCGATSGCS
jgi:ribonucleoside-diphosphate reductase alpha chain